MCLARSRGRPRRWRAPSCKKARLKATMLVMQREGGERSPCSSCAFVHASFMSVPRSEAVVGCFPAHNTRTTPLHVTLAHCCPACTERAVVRRSAAELHTLVQEKDAR
eukprot:COSAG06_NODE_4282_length_4403_cov_3.811338_4_plen_108_part_00